ncbi:MAG: cofactor-independent phosphoglycerate mutase [Bacteroidaceae bacterium]|nr:cofactor-independent phosphoglycerate mutase [Bacteroidaceae bacterium]
MKHLIILGDGMADWHVPSLGDKTLLQYADTPAMDWLARNGRCGLLKTVPDGFHPGSEVANSSILGYDQHLVYEGRGPLEAASIGVELQPGDLAMRCNLVCIEGDILKNHSCGRLETEEGDQLIRFLNEHLASDPKYGGRVRFYTGVQYRHLLVIHGGNKHLNCTPPHDIPLQPWRDHQITAVPSSLPSCSVPGGSSARSSLSSCSVPGGSSARSSLPPLSPEETAALLRDLVLRSQQLLPTHPLNIQRAREGRDMASSIWPWGGGYRPQMTPLTERFRGQIRRGSVITAVDLIRGIGHYAGLRVIHVPGATGLYDTNYEGKAQAAIDALRSGDDFVYLHVEASDEAGHDGSVPLKLQTIEDLDHRLIQPILDKLKVESLKVKVALLPDHPTPCEHRTHTAEPIPFAIYYPGIEPDTVQTFDEDAARDGAYGLLEGDEFIKLFMKQPLNP